MMKVVWSSVAQDDLNRILDYLTQHNPEAANHIARIIYNGCSTLAQFP